MAAAKLSDRILAGPVLRMQPDGRLVTLAREGSVPASEEIVRRYRPALVRYAASIVPAHRADDVVQDSLTRALPAVASGEADLHLRAWLYRIVRNTALNDLRDAGPPHEQLDESYDGVEQPPQAQERREQVRSLVAGLQDLPVPQREALLKREMEGRSHTEIGAQMGVSAGAARQLIFRARQTLREGIGVLVPLPLLRQLLESETGGTAAATGGTAISVKTAMAVLATGAAVTAGLAIRDSAHHASLAPAIAAQSQAGNAARPTEAGGRGALWSTNHAHDRSEAGGGAGFSGSGGDSDGSAGPTSGGPSLRGSHGPSEHTQAGSESNGHPMIAGVESASDEGQPKSGSGALESGDGSSGSSGGDEGSGVSDGESVEDVSGSSGDSEPSLDSSSSGDGSGTSSTITQQGQD